MSHLGSFSPEALEEFQNAVAEGDVNFAEGETYDFTRCVRADGSHYGTGGKCRIGTETGEKEDPVKAWEAQRKATYDSLKGKSKKEILAFIGQRMRVHGLTEKDTMADLKSAAVSAVHGDRPPRNPKPVEGKGIQDLRAKTKEREKQSIRNEFKKAAQDAKSRIDDIKDEIRRNGSTPELQSQMKMWAKKAQAALEKSKEG